VSEARFAMDVSSVRAARVFACAAVGEVSPEVIEVVAAIVGELAANAIRHAATGFVVRVERHDARIGIEVADVGGGMPVERSPGQTDPSGRGLQIVRALADEWGVRQRAGEPGKEVWASLSLDGHAAGRATAAVLTPPVVRGT
jgi:two-component sensor histidine kinase